MRLCVRLCRESDKVEVGCIATLEHSKNPYSRHESQPMVNTGRSLQLSTTKTVEIGNNWCAFWEKKELSMSPA